MLSCFCIDTIPKERLLSLTDGLSVPLQKIARLQGFDLLLACGLFFILSAMETQNYLESRAARSLKAKFMKVLESLVKSEFQAYSEFLIITQPKSVCVVSWIYFRFGRNCFAQH